MNDELDRLFCYDEEKFRNNYVSDVGNANQAQLLATMIFHTHSLEKGLSNNNFEIGHGFGKAKTLVVLLTIYNNRKYDTKDIGYVNTLSALKALYNRHKDTKFAGQLKEILGDMFTEVKNCSLQIGGADEISAQSKQNNNQKNFEELAKERFAVRAYSDKPVRKKDIEDAIEIATKTPSVCNRQPSRVHMIYKKDIINGVLKVQDGMSYYETPPALLLVTVDDSSYIGTNERNQGFIDGGLFLMSLLYALEYKKLAACPLHAMFDEITEKTVRGMLGLTDNEKLIAFVSVGHFNETSNVCKSFRYPASYITDEIDKLHKFTIEELQLESQPIQMKQDTTLAKLRKNLRLRTRLKNLKHKLRIRTRIRTKVKTIKNGKKDGVIITITGNFNYGNIIQRYALKTFLKKNGYNFDAVKLQQEVSDGDRSVYGNMIDFVDHYIGGEDFDLNKMLGYKNYIVGSDQIWRNWFGDDWNAFSPYFLDFLGNRKTNRISYAASFGVDNLSDAGIDDSKIKLIRPLINKFNAISVREKSGLKLVDELSGRRLKSNVVVDPTLLLTADDYSVLINNSEMKDHTTPKVFYYILDNEPRKDNIIKSIAKSYDNNYATIDLRRGIEQWLKGFRDAEFVATDSFHGAVFSIINNKDFVVFANHERGLSRMESLLDSLGINSDRLIFTNGVKEIDVSNLSKINWNEVNNKLDNLKKNSGEWLLNNVKKGSR